MKGSSPQAGKMTKWAGRASEPPLVRPPLVRPKPAGATPKDWQDGFYVHKHDDKRPVRDPSYQPMGSWKHGPFSSYDAAVEYGSTFNCVYFTVERWYINPTVDVEYIDKPTPMGEEWSDESQFSDTKPTFLDDG